MIECTNKYFRDKIRNENCIFEKRRRLWEKIKEYYEAILYQIEHYEKCKKCPRSIFYRGEKDEQS